MRYFTEKYSMRYPDTILSDLVTCIMFQSPWMSSHSALTPSPPFFPTPVLPPPLFLATARLLLAAPPLPVGSPLRDIWACTRGAVARLAGGPRYIEGNKVSQEEALTDVLIVLIILTLES
jgi:hypothetical protein